MAIHTTLWTPKIYTEGGFVKDNILGNAKALDIGCGGRKLPGSVGMDMLALTGVDVVHNLNTLPWPFPESSFDLVFANHALEHVEDVIATLSEVHRVLKPGGRFVMQVPYFRSVDAYADPTHRHFFTSKTLDYVISGTQSAQYAYTPAVFTQKGFWYGWPRASKNKLKRALKRLITRNADVYDQYLSLMFPTECLTWELEAVK